jgi:hypothetical protein
VSQRSGKHRAALPTQHCPGCVVGTAAASGPGRPTAVDAKPFVPAGTASSAAQAKAAAGPKPQKGGREACFQSMQEGAGHLPECFHLSLKEYGCALEAHTLRLCVGSASRRLGPGNARLACKPNPLSTIQPYTHCFALRSSPSQAAGSGAGSQQAAGSRRFGAATSPAAPAAAAVCGTAQRPCLHTRPGAARGRRPAGHDGGHAGGWQGRRGPGCGDVPLHEQLPTGGWPVRRS